MVGKNKVLMLVCALVLVIAGISTIPGTSQGSETSDPGTDGEIVMSAYVSIEGESLDNATVELLNSTGEIVDSATTDQDGYGYVSTTQNLTDATLRITHTGRDETLKETGIDHNLPGDNTTAIHSYSFTYDETMTEEASSAWSQHPYVIIGAGAVFLLGIFTVIQLARDKTGW